MKAIVCEMCSSQDVVKQDGVYVCQSCGTKYSVEEAKKLLTEVPDAVPVGNTKKLDNYYVLARQAKKDSNSEVAAKYYSLIREENPYDWEACFYSAYFSSMQTNLAGLETAVHTLAGSAVEALRLLKNQSSLSDAEKETAYLELGLFSAQFAQTAANISINHYNRFSTTDNAKEEMQSRIVSVANMCLSIGDAVEEHFPNDDTASISLWEMAISMCSNAQVAFPKFRPDYVKKIYKLKPDYEAPVEKETYSSGCYVATAIYGSYDCPEVWTLRRYRDNQLAATWYGRAFIHSYYAVSPTLVKWFGQTEWFRNLWKPKLDRMVERLHRDGVEDTPYQDREW